MTDSNSKKAGFTLIELMFAMAFVAFLMIFIITSIVQIMRIYNKGLAIRDINQSGRQLTEDMTRSLRYTDSQKFALRGYQASKQRICANGVTYAWNIEGAAVQNKYTLADPTPVSLIRVDDPSGDLCLNIALDIPKAQSRDLLNAQLAVQKLSLVSSEAGRIVTIKALISTQGANKPVADPSTVSGFACPGGSDGAFCAFGDFQTTVYIRN